jgi:nucleotide-binding universal stress UspA family protein
MSGVMQNVMVFVDGTEQSVTAAQYAILLCRQSGARLSVLYVVNTRALTDLVKAHIFLEVEQDEYKMDLESDAERYLNHVVALGREKGIEVEAVKRSGTVHQEIKNEVAERGVDLLVLGELAKIRSRRDEFFDEAERAMRGVGCPVLIVRDEDRIWELFEEA